MMCEIRQVLEHFLPDKLLAYAAKGKSWNTFYHEEGTDARTRAKSPPCGYDSVGTRAKSPPCGYDSVRITSSGAIRESPKKYNSYQRKILSGIS